MGLGLMRSALVLPKIDYPLLFGVVEVDNISAGYQLCRVMCRGT